MDTQGTFDTKSIMQNCTIIFALSTLVSSLQIFNISPRIQEDDLENLRYFTEYAKLVEIVEGEQAPLQRLLFLIRDWPHAEDYAYGYEEGKEYLNEILEVIRDPFLKRFGGLNERLATTGDKSAIRSRFKPLLCFLMSHPGIHIDRDEFEMSGSFRILGGRNIIISVYYKRQIL